MPKARQTVNILDPKLNLVTLHPGDEIPEWALARITNPAVIAAEGEFDSPVEETVVEAPAVAEPDAAAPDYSKLDKKGLVALCTERGLPVDGNKTLLTDRLKESDVAAATDAEPEDAGDVDVWSLDEAELKKIADARGIDIEGAETQIELATLVAQASD